MAFVKLQLPTSHKDTTYSVSTCLLDHVYSFALSLLLTLSCMTDETMLGSRQPTQEELDEPPAVPLAADQLRRRLLKTANIDLSSFETDELSPR